MRLDEAVLMNADDLTTQDHWSLFLICLIFAVVILICYEKKRD